MSRKFYVTLSPQHAKQMDISAFPVVHADEVCVGAAGELAFTNGRQYIVCIYAPGVWMMFSEDA